MVCCIQYARPFQKVTIQLHGLAPAAAAARARRQAAHAPVVRQALQDVTQLGAVRERLACTHMIPQHNVRNQVRKAIKCSAARIEVFFFEKDRNGPST